MSSTSSFGASTAPSGPQPTWRDLPEEPPYGPVRPPRTAHIGPAFPESVEAEDPSTISPTQIALAVGGTLLLVAVGIGAALLLLRGPDEVADADAPPPPASAPAEEEFDPLPELPAQPPLAPDAPQGQLEPQPAPGQPPQDQPPQDQPPAEELPGAIPPSPAPPGQAPGAPPASATEEGFDLPRLFVLRTLPSGMSEESTTVRQTTRDDEVVIEQTTLLATQDGEVSVRATRAEDAEARLEALLTDEAEEMTVRGVPAHLVEEGRLVWLLPGDPSTLMELTAPATTRTDQLLTIGNGLELLR